ncbi:MAG: NotI family restriction endonuclease [Gammaproteobacteria bacterium]|nr:NotI family restriction endonuclease [Gammaproteobacteria bacterium]MCY4323604.1 NotI family restriction endonuclease [Gammaproteobacteria bacterium]
MDVAASKDVNWEQVVVDEWCPYTNSRCFKVRKSQPEISIGTCTVRHGRKARPIVICPKRLLQRKQIFVDSLHLLRGHYPGNELYIVPEVALPGGSVD